MKDAWKKFKGDFNAMLDHEIDEEVSDIEDQMAIGEEWLEAVASWKAAGKPRNDVALDRIERGVE